MKQRLDFLFQKEIEIMDRCLKSKANQIVETTVTFSIRKQD